MKRLITMILLLSLVLSCAACAGETENQTVFYYLRTEETIAYGEVDALIAPVNQDISPDIPLNDALQLYLKGPAEENFIHPMPKGTTLVSTILREDMLVLVLSREFSTLDGIQLTLAGACLTATCYELTGLEQIQVRSGEHVYDFNLSDFVFLDDTAGE